MDSRPAVIQEIEKTTSEKVYSKLSTSDLSKELAESVLKEEERYNIDEMKKRAIHVSRSYDEFRQMVLCANLKVRYYIWLPFHLFFVYSRITILPLIYWIILLFRRLS